MADNTAGNPAGSAHLPVYPCTCQLGSDCLGVDSTSIRPRGNGELVGRYMGCLTPLRTCGSPVAPRRLSLALVAAVRPPVRWSPDARRSPQPPQPRARPRRRRRCSTFGQGAGRPHAAAVHPHGLGPQPPGPCRPSDPTGRSGPPADHARPPVEGAQRRTPAHHRCTCRAPGRALPAGALEPRPSAPRPRPSSAPPSARRCPTALRTSAARHLLGDPSPPRPHAAPRAARPAASLWVPDGCRPHGHRALRCDGLRGRARPSTPRGLGRLRRRGGRANETTARRRPDPS